MTNRLLQAPLDLELPDRTVKISSELARQESVGLEEALKRNTEVFAWSAKDMPEVSPEVITHRLNVDLTCHPIKQKRRKFALDHS